LSDVLLSTGEPARFQVSSFTKSRLCSSVEELLCCHNRP
jgi:hypothetical protein